MPVTATSRRHQETPAPGERPRRPERVLALRAVRGLLGIPLFHKLLVANVAMVLLTAVGAGLMAVGRLDGGPPEPGHGPVFLEAVAYAGVSAAALSAVLNAFLLRVALAPLRQIEDAARRVAGGDTGARVQVTLLADAEHRNLAEVLNRMLDTLETSRIRQRELALRVLSAEENERRRVAWELYDGAAQTLASILLRIQLATGRRAAGKSGSEVATGPVAGADSHVAFLGELRGDVLEALRSIQGLARRLRPPELDDLGLLPALEAEARSVGDLTGLRVTVESDGAGADLAGEAALTVYRIVEEGLRNIARHAAATAACVRIYRGAGTLLIDIEDDGVGFDPHEVLAGATPAAGLLGMRQRAEYLGGGLEVETGSGAGTRLRVTLPLHRDRTDPGAADPGTRGSCRVREHAAGTLGESDGYQATASRDRQPIGEADHV